MILNACFGVWVSVSRGQKVVNAEDLCNACLSGSCHRLVVAGVAVYRLVNSQKRLKVLCDLILPGMRTTRFPCQLESLQNLSGRLCLSRSGWRRAVSLALTHYSPHLRQLCNANIERTVSNDYLLHIKSKLYTLANLHFFTERACAKRCTL